MNRSAVQGVLGDTTNIGKVGLDVVDAHAEAGLVRAQHRLRLLQALFDRRHLRLGLGQRRFQLLLPLRFAGLELVDLLGEIVVLSLQHQTTRARCQHEHGGERE
jgi:hypothetical protein